MIRTDVTQPVGVCLQVKSGKGPPNRADILLSALNDLMNTLFNHPVDKNLICAVKLLKVFQFFLLMGRFLRVSSVALVVVPDKLACILKCVADGFSPGRRMEEKWKAPHGRADQKDRKHPPRRHLQQVCVC